MEGASYIPTHFTHLVVELFESFWAGRERVRRRRVLDAPALLQQQRAQPTIFALDKEFVTKYIIIGAREDDS